MSESTSTLPPRGRPTKCTPELLDHLYLNIRTHGVSDSDAAALVGLCPSTLSRWKQEQPELRLALQQARLQFQQERLAAIRQACDAQGRKSWRAQVWLLEQACPEIYGRSRRRRAASVPGSCAAVASAEPCENGIHPEADLQNLQKSTAADSFTLPENPPAIPPAFHEPAASSPSHPLPEPLPLEPRAEDGEPLSVPTAEPPLSQPSAEDWEPFPDSWWAEEESRDSSAGP